MNSHIIGVWEAAQADSDAGRFHDAILHFEQARSLLEAEVNTDCTNGAGSGKGMHAPDYSKIGQIVSELLVRVECEIKDHLALLQGNFFITLGIRKDCSAKDIKRAYRAFALRFHPDKSGPSCDTTLLFQTGQNAYEALSDDETRRRYKPSIMPGDWLRRRAAEMKRMSKIYEQRKHTEDRSIGAKNADDAETIYAAEARRRHEKAQYRRDQESKEREQQEEQQHQRQQRQQEAARAQPKQSATYDEAAMNAARRYSRNRSETTSSHSGPREKASAANSSPTGDSSGDQSASWLKKWQLQRLKGASLLQELRSKNVNLPGLSGISSGTEIGRGGAYEKSELVSAYLSARSAARAFELASMSDRELAKAYRQHPYHQRRAPRETSVPIDLPYSNLKRDEVLRLLLLADAHDDEEDSEDCDVTATSRQNYKENPNMNNFQKHVNYGQRSGDNTNISPPVISRDNKSDAPPERKSIHTSSKLFGGRITKESLRRHEKRMFGSTEGRFAPKQQRNPNKDTTTSEGSTNASAAANIGSSSTNDISRTSKRDDSVAQERTEGYCVSNKGGETKDTEVSCNQDQKRKNRGSEDLYNLELNWARPQAGLIDEHDDEEEDAEDSDGSSNENEWDFAFDISSLRWGANREVEAAEEDETFIYDDDEGDHGLLETSLNWGRPNSSLDDEDDSDDDYDDDPVISERWQCLGKLRTRLRQRKLEDSESKELYGIEAETEEEEEPWEWQSKPSTDRNALGQGSVSNSRLSH